MTKIINVEVAELLRHEADCIRARELDGDQGMKGCRVEIAGPSSVLFDDSRARGARVWVETTAPVRITNTAGQVREFP